MAASGGSTKVILAALLANFGIAIAKFVGAFISKSASLFAEAIHSLVDCSNQVLLLMGSKKAKLPPSPTHPLGYGREAFFWSFIVAILLFSLGGLFAIYEGYHKLHEHSEINSPEIGLGVLIFSTILEWFSFWVCFKEVKAQNTYNSLWTWFRKTTSVELLVIFTEDAAAMLGLIIATISLLLSWLTGNSTWDAAGSIVIGILLVIVAVLLAIEIKSLIIGEAPTTDFKSFIDSKLGELIPSGKILNLIALQVGPGEVMLSCKLSPGNITDVDILIAAINQLEKEIKIKFPEVKWQFVEPDTTI